MMPAAERLLNESTEFNKTLLEIKNWKLKEIIKNEYVAIIQINFTYPYEISLEKQRDMVVIEFISMDAQTLINEESWKLEAKCPK